MKKRKEFADYIINENIDYDNIFFTDEKRFLLNFFPNEQTYQIRLTKENQMKLKQGNDEKKLIRVEIEKRPERNNGRGRLVIWSWKIKFSCGDDGQLCLLTNFA